MITIVDTGDSVTFTNHYGELAMRGVGARGPNTIESIAFADGSHS